MNIQHDDGLVEEYKKMTLLSSMVHLDASVSEAVADSFEEYFSDQPMVTTAEIRSYVEEIILDMVGSKAAIGYFHHKLRTIHDAVNNIVYLVEEGEYPEHVNDIYMFMYANAREHGVAIPIECLNYTTGGEKYAIGKNNFWFLAYRKSELVACANMLIRDHLLETRTGWVHNNWLIKPWIMIGAGSGVLEDSRTLRRAAILAEDEAEIERINSLDVFTTLDRMMRELAIGKGAMQLVAEEVRETPEHPGTMISYIRRENLQGFNDIVMHAEKWWKDKDEPVWD